MVKYTQEQRTRLVESYFTSNESIVVVQRDFLLTFSVMSSPSYDCIINLVKRFREFGTVSDWSSLLDQEQHDLKSLFRMPMTMFNNIQRYL